MYKTSTLNGLLLSLQWIIKCTIVSGLLVTAGCTEVTRSLSERLVLHNGDTINLSDYSERTLVINYWAIWCPTCIKEVPELNTLNKKADVDVVGVNFDGEQGAALTKMMKKLNIDFPQLKESPHGILGLDMPSVLPVTVLYRQGKKPQVMVGEQTVASIMARMTQAGFIL